MFEDDGARPPATAAAAEAKQEPGQAKPGVIYPPSSYVAELGPKAAKVTQLVCASRNLESFK